jgi:hypothetical protein
MGESRVPLRITISKRSWGYVIPGRRGRYEGNEIHETKDCPNCEYLAPVEEDLIAKDLAGVCTAPKHWRVIIKKKRRKPQKCNKVQKLAWKSEPLDSAIAKFIMQQDQIGRAHV